MQSIKATTKANSFSKIDSNIFFERLPFDWDLASFLEDSDSYVYRLSVPGYNEALILFFFDKQEEQNFIERAMDTFKINLSLVSLVALFCLKMSGITSIYKGKVKLEDIEEIISEYAMTIDESFVDEALRTSEVFLDTKFTRTESLEQDLPEEFPLYRNVYYHYDHQKFHLTIMQHVSDNNVKGGIDLIIRRLSQISRFISNKTHEITNQQVYHLLTDRITMEFTQDMTLSFLSANSKAIYSRFFKQDACQAKEIKFPDQLHDNQLTNLFVKTFEEAQRLGVITYFNNRPNFMIILSKNQRGVFKGFTLSFMLENPASINTRSSTGPIGSSDSKHSQNNAIKEIINYSTNNEDVRKIRNPKRKSGMFGNEKTSQMAPPSLSSLGDSESLSGIQTPEEDLVVAKEMSQEGYGDNPMFKRLTSSNKHFRVECSLRDLKNSWVNEWLPSITSLDEVDEVDRMRKINRMATRMEFTSIGQDYWEERYEMRIEKEKIKKDLRIENEKEKPKPSQMVSKESDKAIIDGWTLDTYATPDVELLRILYSTFELTGFKDTLMLTPDVFITFFWEIKWHYNKNSNPFHNFCHGVAVAHSVQYLLRHSRLKTLLTETQHISAFVAAICHDVGHTGRNNTFETNTHSKLALRYHDRSILEQHHAALTCKILYRSAQSNLFQKVSSDERKTFRKNIIECILATDMKEHFDIISTFKNEMTTKGQLGETEEEKMLITKYLVHACDLSGPSKSLEFAEKWSKLCSKEFSAQAEAEAK